MIEKGDGNKYRGKNMDEININVNELISDAESTDDENEKPENDTNEEPINSTILLPTPEISCALDKNQIISPKIKNIIPWSYEKRALATKFFKMHILLDKAPKKKECETFLTQNPEICKPWKKIKDFVHNAANTLKNKKKRGT